jgi:hypothetical protein
MSATVWWDNGWSLPVRSFTRSLARRRMATLQVVVTFG